MGLPRCLSGREPPANAGEETPVRSLGQEDPLEKSMATQCSCLENPMDRGAWWVIVRRVTKSLTWLKRLTLLLVCAIALPWIKWLIISTNFSMFSVCFQDSVQRFQISLSLTPPSQTNVGSTRNLDPGKMADSWGVPWWSPPRSCLMVMRTNELMSFETFKLLRTRNYQSLLKSSSSWWEFLSVFAGRSGWGWQWGWEGESSSEQCGYVMNNRGLQLANKNIVMFEFQENNELFLCPVQSLGHAYTKNSHCFSEI